MKQTINKFNFGDFLVLSNIFVYAVTSVDLQSIKSSVLLAYISNSNVFPYRYEQKKILCICIKSHRFELMRWCGSHVTWHFRFNES